MIMNFLKRTASNLLAGAGAFTVINVVNQYFLNEMERRADDYLTHAPPGTHPENWEHPGVVYGPTGHAVSSPRVKAAEYDPNVLSDWQKARREFQGWPPVPPNYRRTERIEEAAKKQSEKNQLYRPGKY